MLSGNFPYRVMLKLFILSLALSVVFADDCTVSDFSKVTNAAETCSKLVISSMSVPAGQTLEIPLLDGATLTFQGTTKFGVSNWAGPLLRIRGKSITVNGASGHVLDGQGASYWDGKGGSGTTKPLFFKIQSAVEGSVFNNIHIKNCPERCVSIGGSDHVTLDGWNVDVSDGDTNKLGHNTDGFDISSSTYVLIQNTKVYNQDDCIAVNQGSHMTFYNMYCSGGHGMSLSVGLSKNNGADNTVTDINFLDSTVVNSANAIHVKTHPDGGTGQITDVTYRNIQFSGITNYGITIEEDYGYKGSPKNNVPIKNLVFDNVTGKVNSGAVGVYIVCADGGCMDWKWSGVSVSGQKKNDCNYTPSGFKC